MDLKHEKAVHQEEMKSKEDERQKLVLDLKKEKAVHKEEVQLKEAERESWRWT